MKLPLVLCLCVTAIWATPRARIAQNLPKHHPNARIVGGIIAAEGQFPWQVAIYYDTPDGNFFCGGALVAPNWVLTAGHCVYEATAFTLHLGSNTLVDEDTHRVTVSASHSVLYPGYNPVTSANDIGLIKIDTAVPLNKYIQIIVVDTAPLESDKPVLVSGWGANGDWEGVSDDLLYVEMKTITNTECRLRFGSFVTDSMVCTVGVTKEGICNGDVGGPLVVLGSGNTHFLVGVASWVNIEEEGCETTHPSGFTRIAPYVSWIKYVIG